MRKLLVFALVLGLATPAVADPRLAPKGTTCFLPNKAEGLEATADLYILTVEDFDAVLAMEAENSFLRSKPPDETSPVIVGLAVGGIAVLVVGALVGGIFIGRELNARQE